MAIHTGEIIRDPTTGEWTTELIPYEQIEQSELPGYAEVHPPQYAAPDRAWRPKEGQYVSGSALGGYFPKALPTGLIPPWRRIQEEAERERKEWERQQETRIAQLQANDWLVPVEKIKLKRGEITQSQAEEMGRYRKRIHEEGKVAREEARRPKTPREQFIKSLVKTKFEGIDPRFRDRQKDKKELFNLKLGELKKHYQVSFDKDPTGSDLFKIRLSAQQAASTEIDEKADKDITMLDNVIKYYDDQQKAKASASQEELAILKSGLRLKEAEFKERLVRGRPKTDMELRAERKEKLAAAQITKGTSFTDEQGNRTIPFFDATGRFIGTQPIGKVKPIGAMTENQIYRAIYDTLFDKGKEREISQWYTKYKTNYSKTRDRSLALSQTLADINKIILPSEITKTSQAVDWLIREHGMTDQEAKAWIRANK